MTFKTLAYVIKFSLSGMQNNKMVVTFLKKKDLEKNKKVFLVNLFFFFLTFFRLYNNPHT